jgi:anti-sigma factor RsiW
MNDTHEIDEQCRPFEEDLSAWIDGEVAAERLAPLRAHVESCGACTRRVAALRAIDVALRGAAEADAAADASRLVEVRRSVDAALRTTPVERPLARRAAAPTLVAPLAAGRSPLQRPRYMRRVSDAGARSGSGARRAVVATGRSGADRHRRGARRGAETTGVREEGALPSPIARPTRRRRPRRPPSSSSVARSSR